MPPFFYFIFFFFGLTEENFIISILEYNFETQQYMIFFYPIEEYFNFFS